MKQVLYILTLVSLITFFSCRKEGLITSKDALLTITADTIRFDTVFTTTGSITQRFKIINQNNQRIKLDNIKLGGSSGSSFDIIADGFKGPDITNLEIEANDSIYVFAAVTINPNSEDLPFIVSDSIEISYNGNQKYIQLEAYGQNAHFLRNTAITSSTNWVNDLPYVILGGLTIAENVSLTIEKGCRIYFHADAPLFVDGTLRAAGEKYDSTRIYFSSDRLDQPYASYPGSWPGIYFRETSSNNELLYAVVKNAYQGLAVVGPAMNAVPKLKMENCLLDNIYDAAILGIATSITAVNCQVTNSGGEESSNINLVYGGDYDFNHCTIASYGNSYLSHKNPVLYLSNYLLENNIRYPRALNARFSNSIFWGSDGGPESEIVVTRDGNDPFSVTFNNCLWKAIVDPDHIQSSDIIRNLDPQFEAIDGSKLNYNFRLKENSPAIDKGILSSSDTDLDGNPRPTGAAPDLGAYEKQ